MYENDNGMSREQQRLLRKKKLKRRRIIRAVWVFGLLIIIVGLIVTLIVFGIRAMIKAFKGNEEQTALPKVVELQLPEPEAIPEPTPEPTPDNLGYNSEATPENSIINGIPVFGGYKVHSTDSTYYIASENVQSTYGILIDATNGEVVCQKEGFSRINPASMTKILTVLVAAEHLNENDLHEKIKITNEDTYYAYKHDLSAVNFKDDEIVTVEDLFYGTILPSGADAAIALARYVAGDEDSFIDMMNAKIEELGLENTHFTNCVGLYNENHYSTCADMAIILKAALENDYCFQVMNAHRYTTTSTPEHSDGIEISNWFLRRIEDKDTNGEVLCAKTGYVNQSGSCAASFALQNNGKPYICVTAQAHSAWRCIYDQVDIYYNCACVSGDGSD